MKTLFCWLRFHRSCPGCWPEMEVGLGFSGFRCCSCSCHDDEEPRRNALLRSMGLQ